MYIPTPFRYEKKLISSFADQNKYISNEAKIKLWLFR